VNPLELALDTVAAYRLTRLATADTITEPLRGSIITASYAWNGDEDQLALQREANPFSTWADLVSMDPEPPKMAKLVTCRWCAGWWISVLVVLMRRRHPRLWQPVAEVAACSAAAALIARLEKG
jgi:hypothetical protein